MSIEFRAAQRHCSTAFQGAIVLDERLVVVKGAGDLATGVACRLHRVGFHVLMTEVGRPTVIRRTVAFAEAVHEGRCEVEGIEGLVVDDAAGAQLVFNRGAVAVLVDPEARTALEMRPSLLVDAIIAKRNLGTRIGDAPAVVALGPGFRAGLDAHAVVETMRGHDLGRVLWEGEAAPNTGIPGEIGGHGAERVLRAPRAGIFTGLREIGDRVEPGDRVGDVDGEPVLTSVGGVLRGILRSGLPVTPGFKVGDVDPRAAREHCFTVSDKALAVAGGVLEAAGVLLGGFRLPAAG
ncbi:MAG: selenium-dependent molybdenum cofactor biosynthesis protein YqeB [Thermoleophilia bacterium]